MTSPDKAINDALRETAEARYRRVGVDPAELTNALTDAAWLDRIRRLDGDYSEKK